MDETAITPKVLNNFVINYIYRKACIINCIKGFLPSNSIMNNKTSPTVLKIVEELKSCIGSQGELSFQLAGIFVQLENKDILGGVLQSWLKAWLDEKNFKLKPSAGSQAFPDFCLACGSYLELKTFNSDASPAFDIANFRSYCDSILVNPERLDSDYLIFGYKVLNKKILIKQIWVHKVWEICGPSDTNIISLQIKRQQPYNIRPRGVNSWSRSRTFSTRLEFVKKLHEALVKFSSPKGSLQGSWVQNICDAYKKSTGKDL